MVGEVQRWKRERKNRDPCEALSLSLFLCFGVENGVVVGEWTERKREKTSTELVLERDVSFFVMS